MPALHPICLPTLPHDSHRQSFQSLSSSANSPASQFYALPQTSSSHHHHQQHSQSRIPTHFQTSPHSSLPTPLPQPSHAPLSPHYTLGASLVNPTSVSYAPSVTPTIDPVDSAYWNSCFLDSATTPCPSTLHSVNTPFRETPTDFNNRYYSHYLPLYTEPKTATTVDSISYFLNPAHQGSLSSSLYPDDLIYSYQLLPDDNHSLTSTPLTSTPFDTSASTPSVKCTTLSSSNPPLTPSNLGHPHHSAPSTTGTTTTTTTLNSYIETASSKCLPKPVALLPSQHCPSIPSTATPVTHSHSISSQISKNEFLVRARREGLSYKHIKRLGNFSEAESTLRGRYRILTKEKRARVRKPLWSPQDITLLKRAVQTLIPHDPDSRHTTAVNPAKIPWKRVAEYIADRGGSYCFGFATCKRKWLEIRDTS